MAHLDNFSFELFHAVFTEDVSPLLLYNIVQRSEK